MPDTNLATAQIVAERVRAAVAGDALPASTKATQSMPHHGLDRRGAICMAASLRPAVQARRPGALPVQERRPQPRHRRREQRRRRLIHDRWNGAAIARRCWRPMKSIPLSHSRNRPSTKSRPAIGTPAPIPPPRRRRLESGRALQSLSDPCFPVRAGDDRLRRQGHGLVSRPCADRDPGKPVAPARRSITRPIRMGEYVFDHGLAEAFERAGGRYYPEALCAVPFTPVNGRRLLVAADAPPGRARGRCWRACATARETGRVLAARQFPDQRRQDFLRASGFIPRKGQQFHFFNRGYADFRRFPGARWPRASARRSARSARQALPPASRIEWLTGADLTRGALGRVFRLLHGHRRAQMGPALSHPRLLFRARRKARRPHPAGAGAARGPP